MLRQVHVFNKNIIKILLHFSLIYPYQFVSAINIQVQLHNFNIHTITVLLTVSIKLPVISSVDPNLFPGGSITLYVKLNLSAKKSNIWKATPSYAMLPFLKTL